MSGIDYVVDQIKSIKMDKLQRIMTKLPLPITLGKEGEKRGRKRYV